MTTLNPITGEDEPYFPERRRLHRVLAGSVVVMMMVQHPRCLPCLANLRPPEPCWWFCPLLTLGKGLMPPLGTRPSCSGSQRGS
jgi:hypothetical protein